MQLNKEQAKAIRIIANPLLVVAGAGTGKTTMITEKIKFLTEYLNISPDRILAITFTNKAANEMKKRIETKEKKYPYISTFHSFALKILKSYPQEAGLNKGFTIYDEKDQINLIKQILEEKNIKTEPRKILNEISLIKEEKSITSRKEIIEIYKAYQEQLIINNAVDFNDIIILVNELFNNYPDIKESWRDSFDYILVDEFQDTNKPQLKLIKNLYNENYGNLTAVGDPNQCIYSWRGSEISNILNFKNHFKSAKIIKLQQNYRSTKKILYIANSLIKDKIPEEFLPLLKTENKSGNFPVIKIFKSDTEEAKKIASTILYLTKEKNYKYKDIAILVRNTHIIQEIEKQLIKNKIPYEVHGKYNFTERSEIKLILSYLKIAINPKDEIAFKYCINKPSKGIGKKTLEKLKELYEIDWIKTLENNQEIFTKKQKEKVKDFIENIKKIKNLIKENRKEIIIEAVIKSNSIYEYLKQKYKEKAVITKKINNINLLKNLINETDMSIEEFIENLYLQTSQDEIKDKNEIKIITIHSAKGLEFPIVFIPALEQGILPTNLAEIEEERRVLYTAITRAKELVFISAVKYRKGLDQVIKPSIPSIFLKEIINAIPKKTKVQT